MKNRLAIMGLALAMGVPVFAQSTTTPAPKAGDQNTAREDRMEKRREHMGEMKDKMAKELNLTDAQKIQLKEMNQKNAQEMRAIRSDSSLTKEQKMEKMKALRESRESQMSSILTPEQQQKWQQAKANHKGKMGKHHGRGHRKGANNGTQGF